MKRLEILALGAVGAAISLALTGYQFGIINNLFHLPIVAALYNEPQFAHDSFVQALRYYSSGIWMLLEGSDRYVSPYWLFFGLDYLSRLLSFAGFLCCGTLLGVKNDTQRMVFVVILCFSSLLHGYSYPGNGGLFINYFTHSEIANGTILLTLYFAAKGRFTEALALNGAYVLHQRLHGDLDRACRWRLIAALLLWRGELTARSLVIAHRCRVRLGGLFALPVLWNIVGNPEMGGIRRHRFQAFPAGLLPGSYPVHDRHAASHGSVGDGDGVRVCLPVSAWERAAEFWAALWGSVLLYAMGIMLPWLTGLPLILNFI